MKTTLSNIKPVIKNTIDSSLTSKSKISIQYPNFDFVTNMKLLILSAFLTLWQPMLVIFLLILTDTVLAYMVVKKSHLNIRKSTHLKWNSTTFRIKTISKLIGYFLILLCGYAMSQYIDKNNTELIVMSIFTIIAYGEIKSIDEKSVKLWNISFLQNILNLPEYLAGKRKLVTKTNKKTTKNK
jgi:uncharacterized membrane protein